MRNSILVSIFILSFTVLQFSCVDKSTNTYYPGETENITPPHTVVTNIPTAIIPYTELASFQRGTVMKLRVNRKDYEVWEVDVVFDALYRYGNERLILCHVNGDFPVGAGDSGSPLLTSDGRVAGILCYGYYGNSNDFIARAVEDVLNIEKSSSSLSTSSFTPIQPVFIVSGYNAEAAKRYPLLGNQLGEYTIRVDTPYAKGNNFAKIADNLVIPGSSIAVLFIIGDYINYMAIGTLSYISNESMFAFGHNYRQFLAAPAYLASTGSFIHSTIRSFKMSEPSTQRFGSCVKDDFNGILIKQNTEPLVAQVNTTCFLNGQNIFSYRHQISNTPSFTYDKRLAADLSCYLLYRELSLRNILQDSLEAKCTASIITEKETKNTTFTLNDTYIDWRIYYYLTDSMYVDSSSKELKNLNLSIELRD